MSQLKVCMQHCPPSPSLASFLTNAPHSWTRTRNQYVPSKDEVNLISRPLWALFTTKANGTPAQCSGGIGPWPSSAGPIAKRWLPAVNHVPSIGLLTFDPRQCEETRGGLMP